MNYMSWPQGYNEHCFLPYIRKSDMNMKASTSSTFSMKGSYLLDRLWLLSENDPGIDSHAETGFP